MLQEAVRVRERALSALRRDEVLLLEEKGERKNAFRREHDLDVEVAASGFVKEAQEVGWRSANVL